MRIHRQGQDLPVLRPTFAHRGNLMEMQETQPGACMKVVGEYVQSDGGRHQEFLAVGRTAWAAFHACTALWSTPGHLASKLRLLHFTVFAPVSWTAGTRH